MNYAYTARILRDARAVFRVQITKQHIIWKEQKSCVMKLPLQPCWSLGKRALYAPAVIPKDLEPAIVMMNQFLIREEHIMKRIFAFAAIAAIALTACQQELNIDENKPETPAVFTATTESSTTKTALSANGGSYDVLWQNGDQITIVDAAATPNVAVYQTASTTTQGSFSYVSGTAVSTPDYKAWYPATLYNAGTLTLPATQEYTAGNIKNSPMYAESSTESLSFKNICGIIRLNISTTIEGKKVRRIVLTATEGMSGAISNAATLASKSYIAAVSGTDGITLDCGESGVAITTTPTAFHFAVPQNTYTSLNITVITTDGDVQVRTSKSGIAVSRSKITDVTLPFNSLAPTTGSADIFGGASQPWVQLWAGGPKWAKFNVGSTITTYKNVTEWTDATVGPLYNGVFDVAASLWGVNWKFPNANSNNDNDLADLHERCDWVWCDGNSVQYESGCTLTGFKVIGRDPGYTDNSIFLPAAGEMNHSELQFFQKAVSLWYSWGDASLRYLMFASSDGEFHTYKYANTTQWKHSVRAICIDNQINLAEQVFNADANNIDAIVAAFNATPADNPTLTLTGDIKSSITITRADGIIDFNGYTVSENMFLQNDVAGKTLTLRNGTLSKELDGKAGWSDFFAGTVVLDKMTINGTIYTDGHAFEIISGNYTSSIENYTTTGKPGTVVIKGGCFLGKYETNGDKYVKGTYTLYGGKFANKPINSNQSCATGYSVKDNPGDDAGTYAYIVSAD